MTDSLALSQATAEESVLGALLLDSKCLAEVRPLLPIPAAFADRAHAAVYAAVLALWDAGEPVDHVTIDARLRLQAVEVPDLLLAELIDSAVTTAHVAAHARLVQNAWLRRQAVAEAERLRKGASDPDLDLQAVIAESCQRLVPIGVPERLQASRGLASIFVDTLESLDQSFQRHEAVLGIPSGFEGLDAMTDGFQPGTLTILAARPSRGKTAMALTIAKAAALVAPVDIFSIEMTEDQLVARMLQEEIGRDLRQLRRDEALYARYAHELHQASARLSTLPIHIDCTSTTPGRIRLQLQALAARRGETSGLVVIDYLGLMDPDTPQQNRDRELGSITKALKRLARELRVAILLLAQLNRSTDRESRPPELFDLRDSGNIEQDADDVLMLYWPEGKPDRGAAVVDLYARKVRNGHTGKVPLVFEPWSQRWNAAATV